MRRSAYPAAGYDAMPPVRHLPARGVELDGDLQQLRKGSPVQRASLGNLDRPHPEVVGLLEHAFRVLEQIALVEVDVDPRLSYVPLHDCAVVVEVGVAPFDALFQRSRQRTNFLQQHQAGVPLPADGESRYERIDIHT